MIRLLAGVRVLECAVLPTGDQTGRLLGYLGAEVIKIERPGTGDYLRELDVKDTTFAADFADGGRADLLDVLIPIFRERTAAEWTNIARDFDIPICRASSKREALTDPHLTAREIVHDSAHPVAGPYTAVGWPAPVLGQPFGQARRGRTRW
jgi:crotonobetainyl-CoA:carnitine CoA-transferase CaiB-like acyl-CoA transferase